MHWPSILLGAILHPASAMDLGHAAPRDRVQDIPSATITASPFPVIGGFDALLQERGHALRPRQAEVLLDPRLAVTIAPDETCGYLSGDFGSPIACGNGRSCTWAATSGVGLIACGTKIYINCIESTKALDPKSCNDVCQSNTYNLLCTNSDKPYCRTIAFPDGIFNYACEPTSYKSVQSAKHTYDGQKNPRFSTTLLGDKNDITTLSDQSDSVTDPTETEKGTSSSTSNASEETHHSSKASAPVGAIVGGVIGGVVLIAIIGIGVVCLLRRRKASTAANTAPIDRPAMTQKPPTHSSTPAPTYEMASPAPTYEMAGPEAREREPVYEMSADASMKK